MAYAPKRRLPPGLPFLLQQLAAGLLPAAAVLLAARALSLPTLSLPVALAALLSVPAAGAARVAFRAWSIRRRAKRMGAVLPPRWDGEALGNTDILRRSLAALPRGYPGEGMWDRIDELGGLHSVSVLWGSIYLTTDANVIKTALATDFAKFEKGEGLHETLDSVLGTGVFNADGELWKFHRSMTRPYFSRDRISHFEMFDRHAERALAKMKARFARGAGAALDFQDLVARFTLDSATDFLFGRCVHSLRSPLPYAHNYSPDDDDNASGNIGEWEGEGRGGAESFAEAFVGAQRVLAMRLRLGWTWKLREVVRDAAAEHMAVVDAYMRPILEEAVRKNTAGPGRKAGEAGELGLEEGEPETLLDHLVRFTDDPAMLHDESLNIMVAGRDTTAATLTFAVYMLCMYPDVFKRLRAEVLDKIGPTQMPTFENIRTMKYLRAVINETLRLYPVVPFNVRFASCDTTIPNPDPTQPPVFIPEKVGLAYSVFLMHRRKDYWGPDALDFDPDRFIDERLNKYFTANPFIFLPFNAGPRICLGQQFAYNEISFFLIRLLQNFSHMEMDLSAQPPEARAPAEWAGAEGQKGREQVIPKALLTLYVEGGLWVKMTEAERDA